MPRKKVAPKKVTQNTTAAQKDATQKFAALISKEFPLPEIAGVGFKWVNADQRNKKGWVIWAPVEVSGEIGQKVMEHLKDNPIFAANPGMVQGNLFRKGDNTLAWASQEMIEQLRSHNSDKAMSQLSSIASDIDPATGKPVMVRNVRRVQLTSLVDEE